MTNLQIAQLVNSLPEDQALTTLQAVGFTLEAAQIEVKKAKKIVSDDEVAGVLKGFKDEVNAKIVENADKALSELIPDDISEVSIQLYFTRAEKKLPNDQTVQAGFYTEKISIKKDGDEKWTNLTRKGRSGGNGQGGGGGVPTPTDAPFAKWRVYVSDFTNYHQDKTSEDKANFVPLGEGYSAPAGLKKVKDELYAEAARIHGEENRPATWEEVKDYA